MSQGNFSSKKILSQSLELHGNYLQVNSYPELQPIMTDMKLTNPLPIYYSYCFQHYIKDVDMLNLADVFNCAISGEIGTARSSIAYILYLLLMQRQEMPAYRIDCSMLNEEFFFRVFESASSFLRSSRCFLFFYQLHLTPDELQLRLGEYLSASEHYCVATSLFPLETHVKSGHLDPLLAKAFSRHSFATTPLRNNPEEIPSICEMLLNYYNAEYSKHLLGFSPAAQKMLKGYEWPGNIQEAARLMNILVMQTKEVAISETMLHYYLYEGGYNFKRKPFWLHLDMSMTLEEINRHILDYVLRQEGWNQSRVAKRLGISRSTLWRMLKKDV